MRYLCTMAAMIVAAAALGGCFNYKSDTPLVSVGDTGYGGSSKPQPGNIPPGIEHDPCRLEMDKAMKRIEKLDKDLAECKRDRENDKAKWEREKKKLEDERDRYKKFGRD